MDRSGRVFVSEVAIQNYKSIGQCRVQLHPLTLLVGRNGAGKSNFLDALRFVADSLRTTLEHAIRDRGGINEVRRRSRGHPTHFQIGLRLQWATGRQGLYTFRIGSRPGGGFRVQEEACTLWGGGDPPAHYEVREGHLQRASGPLPPKIESDRLYLTIASALPEFRIVYDGLSNMGFYNLNPDRIRDLQDPDPGDLLYRDGRNIASVIRRLQEADPDALERLQEYLRAVVPGITAVDVRVLGPKETVEFRQTMAGDEHPWRFLAASMSDGTLRVLGVLLAAFQSGTRGAVPLIGIEEPEIAIHPGAAMKLMDALVEARRHVQVVLTTHSPDFLDHPHIEPQWILAVGSKGGETLIAPMKPVLMQAVREQLYSAGELLRMDQIEPDETYLRQVTLNDLFRPQVREGS